MPGYTGGGANKGDASMNAAEETTAANETPETPETADTATAAGEEQAKPSSE